MEAESNLPSWHSIPCVSDGSWDSARDETQERYRLGFTAVTLMLTSAATVTLTPISLFRGTVFFPTQYCCLLFFCNLLITDLVKNKRVKQMRTLHFLSIIFFCLFCLYHRDFLLRTMQTFVVKSGICIIDAGVNWYRCIDKLFVFFKVIKCSVIKVLNRWHIISITKKKSPDNTIYFRQWVCFFISDCSNTSLLLQPFFFSFGFIKCALTYWWCH